MISTPRPLRLSRSSHPDLSTRRVLLETQPVAGWETCFEALRSSRSRLTIVPAGCRPRSLLCSGAVISLTPVSFGGGRTLLHIVGVSAPQSSSTRLIMAGLAVLSR